MAKRRIVEYRGLTWPADMWIKGWGIEQELFTDAVIAEVNARYPRPVYRVRTWPKHRAGKKH